jgi:hypothetical protein
MKLEENRPQGLGFFSPGESLDSSFAVFNFLIFLILEKFVLAFLDFKTMGKMETGQARLYLEGLYFFWLWRMVARLWWRGKIFAGSMMRIRKGE